MLLARLDVIVIYIVVVNNVCHLRATSCILLLLMLLAAHRIGRRGHEGRLPTDVSRAVREIGAINLRSQLLRRPLLALNQQLARRHLLGLQAFDLCSSSFIVLVAHLLTHRALALYAALLGDLRCRIEGRAELVETFAHHLRAGGKRDRISLTRRCRCQQTLLLPDITILLGSELSVVETLLKLLPLKLVGIGRHNLIALALMEAARSQLPNSSVNGLTLRFG